MKDGQRIRGAGGSLGTYHTTTEPDQGGIVKWDRDGPYTIYKDDWLNMLTPIEDDPPKIELVDGGRYKLSDGEIITLRGESGGWHIHDSFVHTDAITWSDNQLTMPNACQWWIVEKLEDEKNELFDWQVSIEKRLEDLETWKEEENEPNDWFDFGNAVCGSWSKLAVSPPDLSQTTTGTLKENSGTMKEYPNGEVVTTGHLVEYGHPGILCVQVPSLCKDAFKEGQRVKVVLLD